MENTFNPKWGYMKPGHYLEHWQIVKGVYANHASAVVGRFNGICQAKLTLTFLDGNEVEFEFSTKTIREGKILVINQIREAWEI